MRPRDPRVVATYNRIASNLENANIATQSYLYSASQCLEPYLAPCLAGISTCLEASCQPCFNAREDYYRRRGHHPSRIAVGRRGRDNLGFDFYDDWEREEAEWGNDELERLLSGGEEDDGTSAAGQPGKHPKMMYGSRLGGRVTGKRKGPVGLSKDGGDEPNVIPQSSMFGFLERLPWKIGGRGSGRYRPSGAGLEEGVGRKGAGGTERSLLGQDGQEGTGARGRSASKSSSNSLSSRGDLFPSDDEDAVPLGDEFAMALERRNTNTTSDERASGRRKLTRRSTGSHSSTKTTSTRSKKKGKRESSTSSREIEQVPETIEGGEEEEEVVEVVGEDDRNEIPTMTDLKLEEERVLREEESSLERRRQAAYKLATERGLVIDKDGGEGSDEDASDGDDAADGNPHDPNSKESNLIPPTKVEASNSQEEVIIRGKATTPPATATGEQTPPSDAKMKETAET